MYPLSVYLTDKEWGPLMDQNQMEQEDEGITLGELLQMIRKHIVSAAIVTVVVFAAVAAYTFLTPRKYSATSELLAMSGQGVISDTSNASQYSSIGSYINQQIATYPQLVKTEAVLEPVITSLGLDTTVEETAELITASNPDGTFMVDITAETEDPSLSEQLANAVAESLSAQVSTSMNTMDEAQAPVSLSVVQQAQTPEGPSSPNVPLYLAAGLVAGVILGIGWAIVREMLNTKVDSTSDVRGMVGASSIGSVPDDEILQGNKPVIIAQPGGALAEEYRRIRSNISFLKTDRVSGHGQLLVITSVSPSEGKTTTSINVATALAEDGAKVLLIDADLRHPSVANHLGIEGHAGLAHVLSGQMTPKDVVQTYWKPNFHILPAGKRPANASILLSSDTMTLLVEQALTQYDYVIIDTAPMSVANDGAMFGRLAKGVVLVTAKGITEKKDLQESVETFKSADVPVLGFIFTFADPKKNHAGNYYYYYEDSAKRGASGKRKGGRKK